MVQMRTVSVKGGLLLGRAVCYHALVITKNEAVTKMAELTQKSRSGFAAIVGRPNVGKSTLLNRILGEKIAITSQRPQTTRNKILGIKTQGLDQLVLLDTPGIHRQRAHLNRLMVQEALKTLQGVDCILLVTEVARGGSNEKQAVEPMPLVLHPADSYVLEQIQIQDAKAPVIVVINKIDRIKDRQLLLPLMAAWHDKGFSTIVPLSALKGDGIEDLLQEIMSLMPEGPHLYPEDMFTDQTERFLASELIREQVFEHCRQEIPYATAVEILEFRERPDRSAITIEAIIHMEKDSQKAILIGKGGATIKQLGMAARQEIGKVLGCTVHLQLTVHVEKDWSRFPVQRRKFGYE